MQISCRPVRSGSPLCRHRLACVRPSMVGGRCTASVDRGGASTGEPLGSERARVVRPAEALRCPVSWACPARPAPPLPAGPPAECGACRRCRSVLCPERARWFPANGSVHGSGACDASEIESGRGRAGRPALPLSGPTGERRVPTTAAARAGTAAGKSARATRSWRRSCSWAGHLVALPAVRFPASADAVPACTPPARAGGGGRRKTGVGTRKPGWDDGAAPERIDAGLRRHRARPARSPIQEPGRGTPCSSPGSVLVLGPIPTSLDRGPVTPVGSRRGPCRTRSSGVRRAGRDRRA